MIKPLTPEKTLKSEKKAALRRHFDVRYYWEARFMDKAGTPIRTLNRAFKKSPESGITKSISLYFSEIELFRMFLKRCELDRMKERVHGLHHVDSLFSNETKMELAKL